MDTALSPMPTPEQLAHRPGECPILSKTVSSAATWMSGCKAVNQQGGFGRWRWDVVKQPGECAAYPWAKRTL